MRGRTNLNRLRHINNNFYDYFHSFTSHRKCSSKDCNLVRIENEKKDCTFYSDLFVENKIFSLRCLRNLRLSASCWIPESPETPQTSRYS